MEPSVFTYAACAISLGFSLTALFLARLAALRSSSDARPLRKLESGLKDCEALQSEILQHLGRIEARDKMRQVRAARKDGPSAETPSPGEELEGVKLTTAQLRASLAARKLKGA